MPAISHITETHDSLQDWCRLLPLWPCSVLLLSHSEWGVESQEMVTTFLLVLQPQDQETGTHAPVHHRATQDLQEPRGQPWSEVWGHLS